MANERIQLTDSLYDIMYKLSEGNPGALRVLCEIWKQGAAIDPDWGNGELLFILLGIDSYGVFGPDIWMLYKDVCGQDLRKMLAVLLAVQLGFLDAEALKSAIYRRGNLDLEDLCSQVKGRLPRFQLN